MPFIVINEAAIWSCINDMAEYTVVGLCVFFFALAIGAISSAG